MTLRSSKTNSTWRLIDLLRKSSCESDDTKFLMTNIDITVHVEFCFVIFVLLKALIELQPESSDV